MSLTEIRAREQAKQIHACDILAELILAPDRIEAAERGQMIASQTLEGRKEELQDTVDSLHLEGVLDGKNAETRSAQARVRTRNLRWDVTIAERTLEEARIRVRKEHHRFAALRAAARLMNLLEEER